MISSFEIRIACPSVSFLFACLGGSLGIFPNLEDFVFLGNCLGIALAELLPLLCQSINWFEGLVKERGTMSEVRSNELETRLSSSSDETTQGKALATSALYLKRTSNY